MNKTDKERLLTVLNGQTQAEQVTKRMETPVRFGDLPKFFSLAMQPAFSAVNQVATGLTRTDLSVSALVELLVAKGIFTREEYEQMETQVTESFVAAMSPAEEEAQKVAGDRKVERLVEPAGEQVLHEDEEKIPRRLVEG